MSKPIDVEDLGLNDSFEKMDQLIKIIDELNSLSKELSEEQELPIRLIVELQLKEPDGSRD